MGWYEPGTIAFATTIILRQQPMKSDLPRLMAERDLDAIVVSGNTDTSTDLAYLTGGVKLEGALFVLRRGGEATLVSNALERELAESTGYPVRLWSDYELADYLRAHNNDRLEAVVAQWTDLVRDLGVSGRVGFYGQGASSRVPVGDVGSSYAFLQAFARANPEIEVVGELIPNLFQDARETKDAREMEALRRVGRLTCEVVGAVVAFIQAHAVRDETMVKADGSPLTIGDCKEVIRNELAKRNLDEAHENIFCLGRDGAIGHNTGQPGMPLRLGQTIVFDLFPRDRTTGYFHDVTRTFCLGYAPAHLEARWHQVKTIFDEVLSTFRVGELCSSYQAMACDYFEELGYPTARSVPKTQVGYTHSLGHGVGLDVHEWPGLSLLPGNTRRLQAGHVISIEPGLYDPDEGWAIRIEDTVALDATGHVVNLTDYPYDLVIPVGGAA